MRRRRLTTAGAEQQQGCKQLPCHGHWSAQQPASCRRRSRGAGHRPHLRRQAEALHCAARWDAGRRLAEDQQALVKLLSRRVSHVPAQQRRRIKTRRLELCAGRVCPAREQGRGAHRADEHHVVVQVQPRVAKSGNHHTCVCGAASMSGLSCALQHRGVPGTSSSSSVLPLSMRHVPATTAANLSCFRNCGAKR